MVAICHRNQVEALTCALESVEQQSMFQQGLLQVAVLDDCSDASQVAKLQVFAAKPYVTLLRADCGNASQARNTLLDWADQQCSVQWIARLDADDLFAHEYSVSDLIALAVKHNKKAALGGNQLKLNGRFLHSNNHPNADWLHSTSSFVEFIEEFCSGRSLNELPSCNLILANQAGFRYPNIKSAEDHWLVASLIMLAPELLVIDSVGLYSIYHLNGSTTADNKISTSWHSSRKKLAHVFRQLHNIKCGEYQLLGFGMEGVVYQTIETTIKAFHPWGMSDAEAHRLSQLCSQSGVPIPQGEFRKQSERWYFYSPTVAYLPVSRTISLDKIKQFLCACYRGGIAPLNIKRTNLMFHPNGELHYIDIGKDIVALTSPFFMDLTARLYAIGVLGYSDYEMVRRPSNAKQEHELQKLNGFEQFYAELIRELHPAMDTQAYCEPAVPKEASTTLLMKVCAQDAENLYEQICHIVTQLEYPIRFAEKVLLIDSYPGPFLRQYASPDLQSVVAQAHLLRQHGIIDSFLISPNEQQQVIDTYRKWFGRTDITTTHTIKNAPLFPQIWAFDQIKTRYVLQCDCDVLIGRKRWQHNYLKDMLNELAKPNTHSVGFNIPKQGEAFLPYFGEPGQFAPEVRFGLLDLHKFNAVLPLQNPVAEGHFCLTWHRAMQQFEKNSGQLKSVRGGNPDSFYVHPNNVDKSSLLTGRIRDLIAQGIVPLAQQEAFDLVAQASWCYPKRTEAVIFLLKGCNTPHAKLQRCLNSLCQQTDQDFGVILIDDASSIWHSGCYSRLLEKLKDQTTLVRHVTHQGRLPNFITAINDLCQNPQSIIAILDQDDALMDPDVVSRLKQAQQQGHDLIQMPMFRPNKPLKIYQPDYLDSRYKHGANVWAHLRAFSKACFDSIPKSYFQRESGQWFDTITDYATMLPLSEVAKSPVFLAGPYAYWHQRDEYSQSHKVYQQQLLQEVFAKPALSKALAMTEP